MGKTEKDLKKDFDNTELGKKYNKQVKIFTIILIIAFIPYAYSIFDEALDINLFNKDVITIINVIFDIILIISIVFDARYYGAFAQYKVDKK